MLNGKKIAGVDSLYGVYCDIYPDLEGNFANYCQCIGVATEDLIGDAYAYAARGVLEGGVHLPATYVDFYRLIAAKVKLLLKDAWRSSCSCRGRRSVKTKESLDACTDTGYSAIEKNASMTAWRKKNEEEEQAYREMLASQTWKHIMDNMSMTPKNRKILYAVMLHEMPVSEAAEKYGVTANNIYQMVFRVKKALAKDGLSIYRKFEMAA